MSGGGGRSNHKAGRLVVGAVLIALWAWPVASQEVEQPNPPDIEEPETNGETGPAQSHDEESGESDAAEQAAEPAATVEQTETTEPDPVSQGHDAEADNEAGDILRRDLAAQERMAKAAEWAVIVAIAATVVTLGGVILIAWTLHHTRRAADFAGDMVEQGKLATEATLAASKAAAEGNKLTREIFVESERPRLILSGFTVKRPLTLQGDRWQMTAVFQTRNTGKSAAVGVMFWAKLIPLKVEGDYITPLATFMAVDTHRLILDNVVAQGATHASTPTGMSLKRTEIADAAAESKGSITPMVIGFIEYEFMFDRTRRYTPFTLIGAGSLPIDAESGAELTLNFAQLPSPIRPT